VDGNSHRGRDGVPLAPVILPITWSDRSRRPEPLSPPGNAGQYPKIVNNPGVNPALTRQAVQTCQPIEGWVAQMRQKIRQSKVA
jgi:hypothetical protein